jgi:hypothetical protein
MRTGGGRAQAWTRREETSIIHARNSVLRSLVVLLACMNAIGCNRVSESKKADVLPDPNAFSDVQFDRIRNGFAAINIGQMLIQRTHPTGSYVSSNPPQLILSTDRHEIIGKVTVKWSGGLTKARYETDFTIEMTKTRVRLTVERDTAVLQIEPNQTRLGELDLTNIVRPLL